jgi:cytochrome b561
MSAGCNSVAGLVQVMIYLLLVAIPLSGWAMQGAAGNPVKVFGALTLPQISPESLVLYGALREAHGFLAISLLLLIMLHIAGALYHGLVLRDGVLRRML